MSIIKHPKRYQSWWPLLLPVLSLKKVRLVTLHTIKTLEKFVGFLCFIFQRDVM